MSFNIGDYVKVKHSHRVFVVKGFALDDSKTIPSGWLIDQNGSAVNPEFCERYKGATSVFNF